MLCSIAFRSGPSPETDRKSTRLNSSHTVISYAVFCLKKKKKDDQKITHQDRRADVEAQKHVDGRILPHSRREHATCPDCRRSVLMRVPVECTAISRVR